MIEPSADDERSADAPADPHAVAREIVLRKLTAQARTRHELADALRRRQVPDAVATEVLDRFVEVGLIDDAAFARTFVLARHRERGLARRSLAVELRRKGVAEQDAAEALAQIDAGDEHERAVQWATAKARTVRGLDPPVAARRLAGALARRGYPAGVAWSVAREVLEAPGLEPVDVELGAD